MAGGSVVRHGGCARAARSTGQFFAALKDRAQAGEVEWSSGSRKAEGRVAAWDLSK